MNSLVIGIKDLANRTALNKGFEVIGVELKTHLQPMTIQLQVQPKGGGDVSLDDCSLLSSPISEAFDQAKLLIDPYILEISSPGLSELLKTERDFETFKGFPIEVNFLDKSNIKLQKKGLLHERTKDELKLNCKGRIIIIPLIKVLKVRLTTQTE